MISQLNKNLGITLFKNPNTLNYILFDKLYSLFVLKDKTTEDEIAEYHNKGFVKTNYTSPELVDFVNNNIIFPQEKNIKDGLSSYQFPIDKHYRKKILELFTRDYGDLINKLEKYYNNKIAISEIRVKRNFPINEKPEYYKQQLRDKSKEPYSNYYHVDYYIGTYFKMFINLHDVNENNGPLNIYDISSTKKFVQLNNYKNRNNYKVQDLKDKLYLNTGKKGQTVIANTTKCLHRAGNVRKDKRDIIFVMFGVVPEKIKSSNLNSSLDYYEKQNPEDVWTHTGKFTKLFKPKNLRSTIKLLLKYSKSKLI